MKLAMLFLIILGISCAPKSEQIKEQSQEPKVVKEVHKILVKFTSVTDVDGKQISKDTIKALDTEYFEIGLSSISKGTSYIAQRDIEQSKVGQPFHSEYLSIVHGDGNVVHFNDSNEFLNYMSERGYELVDQSKSKYRTDYTFKKKS